MSTRVPTERDYALVMEATRHLNEAMPLILELLGDFNYYSDAIPDIQLVDSFKIAAEALGKVPKGYLTTYYGRLILASEKKR